MVCLKWWSLKKIKVNGFNENQVMTKELTLIASQLAKNINGVWEIITDEGLSEEGAKKLIKEVIEPTQILLLMSESYSVNNIRFKDNVLKIAKEKLEQQRIQRQNEAAI